MLESFLNYIQYEKRLSDHSVTSYATDLTQFQAFLNEHLQITVVQSADHRAVRSWIVQLVESGIAPSSINRKIASLRAFFKFLLKREIITLNPVLKVRPLKTSKRLPSFVREKEMNFLLEEFAFENSFQGFRDKTIIELLYGTGMRLSELIQLKVSNINLAERNLKVLGKRNKERVIPFSINLANVIKDYLKVREDNFFRTPHLILTDKGEQTYPMMIYRVIKKYLDQVTTVERRSPHVLRHTFATHLLGKGAELNALKDLLGHSSLAATQVYTHNSLDQIKAVFDQAHPKA